MANRFNSLLQDRYVSTYVPLPLKQISNLAEDYTDRYNKGKALPQQFDLLSEKIKAAPIHEAYKQEFIKDYKSKINDLVQNAKPEDYAKPEYQDKIKNLTIQFANDPRLSEIQNTKNWWDKEYMPYKSNTKNARDLDYYNFVPDSKGQYKQIKHGIYGLKSTPYENRYKTQEDIIGNIKDSGYLNSSGYDFSKPITVGPNGEYQGYSKTTNGYTGVTDKKLQDVVNHSVQSYGNTNDGKHQLQEILKPYLGEKAYDLDYNTLQNLAQHDQDAKDMLSHVNSKFATDLFNVGYKQVGGKSTHEVDNKELKDNIKAQKNKEDYETSKLGLPQTSPDIENVQNLTKEIPKDIQHIFGYEKQPDGNYKAKFNPDQFGENTYKGFMGAPNYIKTGEGKLKPEISKAYDYVNNAAKAIGYDTKNLSLTNKQQVEDVLNQYMEYSKNISPQEILQGPQQKVITHNIVNDRNNYTMKDEDGNVIPFDKMPNINEKNFAVTNRTYKDGQQVIKAQFRDQDNGEIKNYTIIPKSNQSNMNYNTIGSIKEKMSKFFTEGKISEDHKPFLNAIEKQLEAIAKQRGENFVSFDSPKYKGPKPIDVQKVPGTNKYIMVLADKNNRKDFYNYLYDPTTGVSENLGGGLDGLEQYISTNWYTNTPEGRSEASQLTNAKGQFEQLTGE